MVEFRELAYEPNDLESLRQFYDDVYVSEFPIHDERESLRNIKTYLRLKKEGWYGKNNYHVLLGFKDGRPVAGSITDYLHAPNAGVIEFLVVSKELRRTGLGRQLLDRTEQLLASDALAMLGRRLDYIVAEMNDPFKQDAAEDSMDPFLRAALWDRWGYGRLDFPYLQPALSREQLPVANMLLIAKGCGQEYANAIPGATLKAILADYMRWAMRIPNPEGTAEYQDMSRAIDRQEPVPMAGLGAYVGRDPARPLTIREVRGTADPDLDGVLCLYKQAFPGGPTDVEPEVFRQAVAKRRRKQTAYHLWAIRLSPDAAIRGMASFFTFAEAGFGGYIALGRDLQGTGRFPLLLARIEEQMIRDAMGARGWYIECTPANEALFTSHGFRTVDCSYHQPRLPGRADGGPNGAPPLRLMYKAFGRNFEAPKLAPDAFLSAIRRIYKTVYRLKAVDKTSHYAHIRQDAARWTNGCVHFR